ncbi:MAG: hypothetical protein PHO85_01175 [Candidatus Cloacimonetes bacterium]|nr:hypothetical protein [Candidatus Cloacimonadota bacterium]MDD2507074.1 hypothetical protein [Candidatus Cloacimonadota bacterium]MDD4147113.1 hypothetical protein [Candidatus Cloacimonadota bacterium]MDD4559974.1 hypothetical protein [Candidatus Cloacimonadota bacterium]
MEHVFDGSSDSAEDLENDIGLLGWEGLGSPLHCQLLLGIVIQVFGGRVDLDVLDDVQDDRQSRVDLGVKCLPVKKGLTENTMLILVNKLPRGVAQPG